jgi:hypothetical protein
MNAYLRAVCWALPIFAIAVLNVLGVVTDGVAQTACTLVPLIAVIALNRGVGCAPQKAG